jgi:hypothetical protein
MRSQTGSRRTGRDPGARSGKAREESREKRTRTAAAEAFSGAFVTTLPAPTVDNGNEHRARSDGSTTPHAVAADVDAET